MMSSRSVRQRCSKAFPATLDEDRISNLPNCLIGKIISFLPTKDAVATSALSTKWVRLWTSVPNLDFEDKLKSDTSIANCFKRFVYSVLLQHEKSCLRKFSLTCSNFYDGSDLNAWLTSVLLCNVQALNLSVVQLVLLPLDLFLCKTLVVLKIDAIVEVKVPTHIFLPVLKTLHLDLVELSDDASLVSLLSGCPVLEELRLVLCIMKDVHVINITSPTLTNLAIETIGYNCLRPASDYKYRYVINTPALKFLNFSDYSAEGYLFTNSNDLIKAQIKVGSPYSEYKDFVDRFMGNPKPITDLFAGISNIRSLVLSHKSMKAIFKCDIVLPIFSKLTFMEIHNAYWRFLPKLLAHSPFLDTLYLRQGTRFGNGSVEIVRPSCLVSYLKVIKVDNFRGSKNEMDMVEYFLDNAKVLEKLIIEFAKPEDVVVGVNISEELQILHRSSIICKVEVL